MLLQSVGEESELFRLTRERDELKALLDKFERHMAEVGICLFYFILVFACAHFGGDGMGWGWGGLSNYPSFLLC